MDRDLKNVDGMTSDVRLDVQDSNVATLHRTGCRFLLFWLINASTKYKRWRRGRQSRRTESTTYRLENQWLTCFVRKTTSKLVTRRVDRQMVEETSVVIAVICSIGRVFFIFEIDVVEWLKVFCQLFVLGTFQVAVHRQSRELDVKFKSLTRDSNKKKSRDGDGGNVDTSFEWWRTCLLELYDRTHASLLI